jgi:hypothetical protein
MKTQKISPVGFKKLRWAFTLVGRATGCEKLWWDDLKPSFTVDADLRREHPRALAHTFWLDGVGVVVGFAFDPVRYSIAHLAQIIRHEIRHWDRDLYGQLYQIPHRCSDPECSIACERALDPIYRYDDAYLAVYRADWKRMEGEAIERELDEEYRRSQDDPWYVSLAKGAAVGAAAGVLIGLTIRGISGK